MPRNGHFTSFLMKHFHEQATHQGRGLTLDKMRTTRFCIIKARIIAASLIHKCVLCRRLREKPLTPQMASLPRERSSQPAPFTFCGVDCFGPFLVKDRQTSH